MGNYTLFVKTFDKAGNEAISTDVSVITTNTITEDTTAPTITNFNLTDGMTVSRKQTVNVSASDDQGVQTDNPNY